MRVFTLTYEAADGETSVLGVYDSVDKIQNVVGAALELVPMMHFNNWESVGEHVMRRDASGNAYVITPWDVK